jgi:hypothetical protein
MKRFSYGIWIVCLGICAAFIAVISAYMQRTGHSPIVLFSLSMGAALGLAAVGAAWLLDVKNRCFLLLGPLAAGILLSLSQHVVLHRLAIQDWQEAQSKEPQLALFRQPPQEDLREYLRQESRGRLGLWLLDAAIISVTAVGIAAGLRTAPGQSNMELS